VVTRVVTIVISSDGNGLAQGLAWLDVLSRLLDGRLSRVGVGRLIMTAKIIWVLVLVLATHDGQWRRGDREFPSGDIEEVIYP
jgi:hypothetical protein